jgi:hypothetical protein
MALVALVATLCAATVASIRWLAVLGVVRDFRVDGTPSPSGDPMSTGWTFTSTSTSHFRLGIASVPSVSLTNLDALAWKLGFIAGIFWVLRLGLRSADRRIGVWRALGVAFGLGLFVATGVLHSIADASIPGDRVRRRVNGVITLWCVVAVAAVLVGTVAAAHTANLGPFTPGVHVVAYPGAWSRTLAALQLTVAVAGWSTAMLLTRGWWRAEHRVPAEPAPLPSTV